MQPPEIPDHPGHPGRDHCEACVKDAERDARFGTDLGPSGKPGDPCCCHDARSDEERRAQAAAIRAEASSSGPFSELGGA
jgi:hypothetical protein